MARKRLYRTRQEKLMANRQKSLKSYHKHKVEIAERKRKKRIEEAQEREAYIARLDRLEKEAVERARRDSKSTAGKKALILQLKNPKDDGETDEESKKKLNELWTRRAEKADKKFKSVCLNSTSKDLYFELLYNRYLVSIREGTTHDLLEEHRAKLESLRRILISYRDKIYLDMGYGDMYDRMDFLEREVFLVYSRVTEMCMAAMCGLDELSVQFRYRRFSWMK
ncbi:hypothetical protein VNI00_015967 [Paramarasmius palmivorus]|uniref:Uncharacterized protein n=1 Tax=Paramarasmius palmivorus TaxID=297713 RepID=A0AAW0BFX9_9AGAR